VESASKIKKLLTTWLCALIVTLSLGETRAGDFFAVSQLESGQIAAVTLESTSDFYGASEYDASGYAVAPRTTVLPVTLQQQKELARLTTAARNDLAGDFNKLLGELSPGQIDAIAAEPWRMRLFFGTAVETRVARQVGEVVQSNPQSVLSGLRWTGRTNAPQDFVGVSGFGFDITGGSWSSILSHQRRAAVDSVITYDSIPSDLGYRFIKWLDGN